MQDLKTTLFIDVYQSGSDLLVIMKGRLVIENCDRAKKKLSEFLTGHIENYYIYLGRLEFVDSAGWGALVGLKMAANRNKTRLMFLSPTQRISEIFKVSKLDTIFEILTGGEAETIRSSLVKRENIVWRDSPDESQERFNTEDESYTPPSGSSTDARAPIQPVRAERQKEAQRLSNDAAAHLRHGDLQKAIDLYRKVLEIDSDDLSALNNLGVVFGKRPEWRSDAVSTWKRVLEISQKRNDEKHAERARRHLDALGAK